MTILFAKGLVDGLTIPEKRELMNYLSEVKNLAPLDILPNTDGVKILPTMDRNRRFDVVWQILADGIAVHATPRGYKGTQLQEAAQGDVLLTLSKIDGMTNNTKTADGPTSATQGLYGEPSEDDLMRLPSLSDDEISAIISGDIFTSAANKLTGRSKNIASDLAKWDALTPEQQLAILTQIHESRKSVPELQNNFDGVSAYFYTMLKSMGYVSTTSIVDLFSQRPALSQAVSNSVTLAARGVWTVSPAGSTSAGGGKATNIAPPADVVSQDEVESRDIKGGTVNPLPPDNPLLKLMDETQKNLTASISDMLRSVGNLHELQRAVTKLEICSDVLKAPADVIDIMEKKRLRFDSIGNFELSVVPFVSGATTSAVAEWGKSLKNQLMSFVSGASVTGDVPVPFRNLEQTIRSFDDIGLQGEPDPELVRQLSMGEDYAQTNGDPDFPSLVGEVSSALRSVDPEMSRQLVAPDAELAAYIDNILRGFVNPANHSLSLTGGPEGPNIFESLAAGASELFTKTKEKAEQAFSGMDPTAKAVMEALGITVGAAAIGYGTSALWTYLSDAGARGSKMQAITDDRIIFDTNRGAYLINLPADAPYKAAERGFQLRQAFHIRREMIDASAADVAVPSSSAQRNLQAVTNALGGDVPDAYQGDALTSAVTTAAVTPLVAPVTTAVASASTAVAGTAVATATSSLGSIAAAAAAIPGIGWIVAGVAAAALVAKNWSKVKEAVGNALGVSTSVWSELSPDLKRVTIVLTARRAIIDMKLTSLGQVGMAVYGYLIQNGYFKGRPVSYPDFWQSNPWAVEVLSDMTGQNLDGSTRHPLLRKILVAISKEPSPHVLQGLLQPSGVAVSLSALSKDLQVSEAALIAALEDPHATLSPLFDIGSISRNLGLWHDAKDAASNQNVIDSSSGLTSDTDSQEWDEMSDDDSSDIIFLEGGPKGSTRSKPTTTVAAIQMEQMSDDIARIYSSFIGSSVQKIGTSKDTSSTYSPCPGVYLTKQGTIIILMMTSSSGNAFPEILRTIYPDFVIDCRSVQGANKVLTEIYKQIAKAYVAWRKLQDRNLRNLNAQETSSITSGLQREMWLTVVPGARAVKLNRFFLFLSRWLGISQAVRWLSAPSTRVVREFVGGTEVISIVDRSNIEWLAWRMVKVIMHALSPDKIGRTLVGAGIATSLAGLIFVWKTGRDAIKKEEADAYDAIVRFCNAKYDVAYRYDPALALPNEGLKWSDWVQSILDRSRDADRSNNPVTLTLSDLTHIYTYLITALSTPNLEQISSRVYEGILAILRAIEASMKEAYIGVVGQGEAQLQTTGHVYSIMGDEPDKKATTAGSASSGLPPIPGAISSADASIWGSPQFASVVERFDNTKVDNKDVKEMSEYLKKSALDLQVRQQVRDSTATASVPSDGANDGARMPSTTASSGVAEAASSSTGAKGKETSKSDSSKWLSSLLPILLGSGAAYGGYRLYKKLSNRHGAEVIDNPDAPPNTVTVVLAGDVFKPTISCK